MWPICHFCSPPSRAGPTLVSGDSGVERKSTAECSHAERACARSSTEAWIVFLFFLFWIAEKFSRTCAPPASSCCSAARSASTG
eukprot:scaffold29844_cov63-Phaeocystis_antarctica.AAC.5